MDQRPIPISSSADPLAPPRVGEKASALDDPLVLASLELDRLAGSLTAGDASVLTPRAALRDLLVLHGAPVKLSPGDRAEFFRAGAHALRSALVDRARSMHPSATSGWTRHPAQGASPADMLALDAAFVELGTRDARMRDVAALRFFVGMSVEHTAVALDLPADIVRSDWHFARAWLLRQVRPSADTPGPEHAA